MLIASLPVPGASSMAGAWLGGQYLLFAVQSGQAEVRPVGPDHWELGQSVSLSPSAAFSDCRQTPYDAIASGSRLVIYAEFGLKSNSACAAAGGFVIANPHTGAMTDPLASNLNFRQMVTDDDGTYLYGLDVGIPAWRQVRIGKIDAATGQVVTERDMGPDVWYLALSSMAF